MKVLVTGHAGFIGFHTAKALLERGDDVVGFDVVNDYYDPKLKEARLNILEDTARKTNAGYHFIRANLADQAAVKACFAEHAFDRVIHLAAQAGGASFAGKSVRLCGEQLDRLHEYSRGLPPQ